MSMGDWKHGVEEKPLEAVGSLRSSLYFERNEPIRKFE